MHYSFILFVLIVYPTVAVLGACSSYRSCKSCLAEQGCGWCAESASCQEGVPTGPASNTSACAKGNCWSFAADTCTEDCSALTTCSDCASNPNCGWCGSTRKCMLSINNFYAPNISIPCGSTCGTDSVQPVSCWKFNNTRGVNWKDNCPTVQNCGLLSNCKDCTNASCFWCGTSQTCMESTGFGLIQPCTYNNGTCGDCWKGSRYNSCPDSGVCSTNTDCFSCTSRGFCGWCFKTQSCVELNLYDNACQGNCTSNTGCFMKSPGWCPSENNHSVECSSFNGDCEQCHKANCGYCVDTGVCMTAVGPEICTNQVCTNFKSIYHDCPASAPVSSTPGIDRTKIIIGVAGGVVVVAIIAGIAVAVSRHRKHKYTAIK